MSNNFEFETETNLGTSFADIVNGEKVNKTNTETPTAQNISNDDDLPNEDLTEENPSDLVLELKREIRNAIIILMRRGALYRKSSQKIYDTIVTHEETIASFLKNLNLQINIKKDAELIYIENLNRESNSNLDDEDVAPPVDEEIDELKIDDLGDDSYLITKRKMSVYDSLIIFILRKYYHERTEQGEIKVVIDVEFIQNLLSPYLKTVVSTTSNNSNLNGTLKRLVDCKIIELISSNSNDVGKNSRYEILPMIKFKIGATELEQIQLEYEKLINSNKKLSNIDDEQLDD